MNSKEIAKLVLSAMEDKKAKDIRVLDIRNVSVIADYFVIGTGDNERQVEAIFDAVDEKLQKAGVTLKSAEGKRGKNWILLDYGDVVVHIFDKESRVFYDLERIWRDGKEVESVDL